MGGHASSASGGLPIPFRARVVPLVLALGILAAALATGLAPDAPVAPATFLVVGPGAAEAARLAGGIVMDDHGAAATATLAPEAVAALAARGLAVEPLSFETGRGAFRFDGRAGDGVVPDDLRSDDSGRYLVQFRGPVTPERRAALEAIALGAIEYVPFHSFIARLPAGASDALAARPDVVFVGPYHPGYKLSPLLPERGSVDATLVAWKDADFARLLADLAGVGADVRSFATSNPRENVARVVLDAARLKDVARLAGVAWIEPAFEPEDALDNAESTAITMTGAVGSWRLSDLGLDGSTQVASICDTGVDTTGATPFTMVHEMFADSVALSPGVASAAHRKVALYYAPVESGVTRGDFDDANGHGTHTAGTLAGDAGARGARGGHDGFGLASKLVVCDLSLGGSVVEFLNDYSNYWLPAYAAGARVNSNSWGSGGTLGLKPYTEKARQHDAFVWDHRDFNIFRSAGNTPSFFRPEALAKNVIAVGATKNGASAEDMFDSSGRGPSDDNRVKPTIVAPGDCVVSAQRGTTSGYFCNRGTSMATPGAAGAGVLVRDYFAKGYYPTGAPNAANARDPSHALVRALLVNSGREIEGFASHPSPYYPWTPAVPGAAEFAYTTLLEAADLERTFPNSAQGWGRVTLDDALYFAGDARKLWVADEGVALATGGIATLQLVVNDASQPLEITLAWTDFPAVAGSNPAIVNDLDLVVLAPGAPTNTPYFGNALVDGESRAIPLKDSRNVEESVILKAPKPGLYTIFVVGASVPSGPQPFALVATGGLV